MNDQKTQKKRPAYSCKCCDFNTQSKNDFNRHLLTAKHKLMTAQMTNDDEKAHLPTRHHKCSCGNVYKYKQGLFVHQKKCKHGIITPKALPLRLEDVKDFFSNNIMVDIIKENREFKSMIIEQQQVIKTLLAEKHQDNKDSKDLMNKMVEITQHLATSNNVSNTTNNTVNNNNQFNLNFFLNETCKDAMNLQEFLDDIRISFEELMIIGDSGFVAGLSDIFIKRLRDLEVTKRPIHCTDAKRETIFLKENNTWNKDDRGNSKLKNIIEKVEYRNVVALRNWCNENPDAMVNNSDQNLLRDKIYLQTLQGDTKTREKIIKNIAKEVTIDRESIMSHN